MPATKRTQRSVVSLFRAPIRSWSVATPLVIPPAPSELSNRFLSNRQMLCQSSASEPWRLSPPDFLGAGCDLEVPSFGRKLLTADNDNWPIHF
jgi:hypothetical protein